MATGAQLDNQIFTNNADGFKYAIDVRFLFNDDGKPSQNGEFQNEIPLSFSHIGEVELAISLDKLYSQGHITYEDANGDISRMNGLFEVACMVSFFQYKQGGDSNFQVDGVNERRFLKHTFMVDNFQIVGKTDKTVTYCIHLTGSEYRNLMNRVDYSSYGSTADNTLVQTIKKILVESGKLKVDGTFDTVTSGVKLNYITSGNDNVQTALDYILQKQFFFQDSQDSIMKFVAYDIIDDRYGMFQPLRSPSDNVYETLISFSNDDLEQMLVRGGVEIASNSSMRKSDMFQPMSKIVSRSYDMGSNSFSTSTLDSSRIVKFFGGESNSNKLPPLNNDSTCDIQRDVSEWDNDFNVYRDFLNIFMNWDSVYLNTTGVIDRRLMSIMNIKFDNDMDLGYSSTTAQTKKNLTRYLQLAGPWYTTKIRYIIKPNEELFKQNLQLSRTNNMS